MVFFGFIITGSGSSWSAKGTSEEAKAIEGAGDSYAAIVNDLRTKVQATDAANPLTVGGGAVTPKSYFVHITTGPKASGGGGGGGGAAAASGGGAAPAAAAAAPAKKESSSEEEMDMGGMFD